MIRNGARTSEDRFVKWQGYVYGAHHDAYATQAMVSANATYDGFQHAACMAKRLNDDSDEEEVFPQTFDNNPGRVCPTVYEDNDTKHVVIR